MLIEEFQSPSKRGSGLNLCPCRVSGLDHPRFQSPSKRGSGLNESFTTREAGRVIPFQSPSKRGSGLNGSALAGWVWRREVRVSIP